MSRSFKKHPYLRIGSPYYKRVANRKVRQFKGDIPNGNWYKKLYESYDIIDYNTPPQMHAWDIEEFNMYKLPFPKMRERYRLIGRYLRKNLGDPELLNEFMNLEEFERSYRK